MVNDGVTSETAAGVAIVIVAAIVVSAIFSKQLMCVLRGCCDNCCGSC